MEKNIRGKVHNHGEKMKINIQEWLKNESATILVNGQDKTNDFIRYMNDFPDLELMKEDFQKRKRLKNNVPEYNRCIALKCNGERCSRKQKNELVSFCGTHLKGANYGTTTQNNKQIKTEKIQLFLRDVNGISRYIDSLNNVYSMEDILNSSQSPRIIGKCKLEGETYVMVR